MFFLALIFCFLPLVVLFSPFFFFFFFFFGIAQVKEANSQGVECYMSDNECNFLICVDLACLFLFLFLFCFLECSCKL